MGECDKTIPTASAVPIAQPVPCVPVAVPATLRHCCPPAHLLYGMMPLPVLSPTPTFTGAATLAVHPFVGPIFAAPPCAAPAIAANVVGAAAALFPALPSPATAYVEAVQGTPAPGNSGSEAAENLLRISGPSCAYA